MTAQILDVACLIKAVVLNQGVAC